MTLQTINLVNDIIHPTSKQREFMRTVKDNTYILYGRWREIIYITMGTGVSPDLLVQAFEIKRYPRWAVL